MLVSECKELHITTEGSDQGGSAAWAVSLLCNISGHQNAKCKLTVTTAAPGTPHTIRTQSPADHRDTETSLIISGQDDHTPRCAGVLCPHVTSDHL